MAEFPDTYPEGLTPPPPGGVGTNVRGVVFIVIVLFTFVIATTVGGIRIYTRAFLAPTLGWDDHTCVLAMICNVGWTIVSINMALKGMGRHLHDVHDTYRVLEVYNHNAFAVNLIYYVTIMLIKLSILFLYFRTFTESRHFRWTVQALMGVIVISHVTFIFLLRYRYSGLTCHWKEYEIDEAWAQDCTESIGPEAIRSLIAFISSLTVVLDLIIIALPCSAVRRLHLPQRQRLAILITLVAGLVVTLTGILRLALLVRRFWYKDDFQYTEWQVNLTSTIEINLALVCISLPVLQAFTRRFFPRILRHASSTRESYFKGQSGERTNSMQPPAHHQSKVSHAGPAGYLELGEDAKSDQNIAMNVIQVKTAIDIESRSER